MSFPGPISIVALNPVACGSTVWRRAGALQVTVVVKATFAIVPDGQARLIAPLAFVAEDVYASASGSLVEPTDLAPYLPTAGVVLRARAHAPHPVPAMTVRLAVFRERGDAPPIPLIDKSLHVFGDRTPAAGAAPKPFQELPIVYERAYGGIGFPDNPAGTGAAADARALPNVVHPADPRQPAGFGPVSKRWAPRRRLLGASDEAFMEQQGAAIPDGVDWRYFHAAPADQQCDFFRGDEWIVLDGMHPTLARVQTRLPSVQAQARWIPPGGGDPGQGLPLRLSADSLVIDAERWLCSLLWRGYLTLENADALARVVAYAGVTMPGYAIAWPDGAVEHPSKAASPVSAVEPATEIDDASTVQRSPALAVQEPSLALPDIVDEATPATVAPTRAGAAALPFTHAAPSQDVAPLPPSPPAKPRKGLGTTAPPGTMSPLAAALPFGTAPATAPPGIVSPLAPARRFGTTAPDMAAPLAPVLPFVTAAGIVSPPAPARPFVTAATPGIVSPLVPAQRLGTTAPPGTMSPFALPFTTAAPTSASPPGTSPSARPVDGHGEAHAATLEMDAVDAERLAQMAPFALAEPGSQALAAAPEIPGAPWSTPGPGPALQLRRADSSSGPSAADDPEFHLDVETLGDPPPAIASPPLVAPAPPMLGRLRLVAAPDAVLDGVASGPELTAPAEPFLDGAASGPEPRTELDPPVEEERRDGDAVAVAPAPRAAPAEPDPGSALRATVQARLASREPLLDLDLTGADLQGVDFGGAALGRINLSGARLMGSKLAQARLAGAQLEGADLTGADLSGADLAGADLSGSILARARFDGALLADANLSGAQGPGASFAEAQAARVSFARGQWDEASFAGAEATQADFTATSLSGARFEGASLVEARFADARGAGAVFDQARLRQARASGATFVGASFRGVDAPSSIWEKATLDETSFAGGNLKDANLSRASCLKTSFAGAELGGANLQRLAGDGADLHDARLGGADLRQARLQDAKLDGAALPNLVAGKADLARARFVRANLSGATLRGARLNGASLAHAQLDDADLRDADLDGANLFGASRKGAKLGRGFVEVDEGA